MNVSREHSTNSLPTVLRGFMGQGTKWPVEMVSELTGISTSSIYQHMSETGNRPNDLHILAYASLFGAEFLNLWTQSIGITGAYRPKTVEGCKFKATLHGINYASTVVLHLSEAADDGVIDVSESRLLPGYIISATTQLNAIAHRIGESN